MSDFTPSPGASLTEVRSGAYADSIVLMRLQAALAERPGVLSAGVVMGTTANKEILTGQDLLTPEAEAAGEGDLILVVRAENEAAARDALGSAEELLARRRATVASEYRPRGLDAAARMLPEASWVQVSVPGRHAAAVAREALELGRHVFLYSDNMSVEDEVALKRRAREAGLFVLGPDCGTAVVDGVGLGFANRVARGAIGLVAASGTGLQAVLAGLDEAASARAVAGAAVGAQASPIGISQAFGVGGRDLSAEVGGLTTLQALAFLAHDPETRVIVLVAKPPSPTVAARVTAAARRAAKPVVICLLGFTPPGREVGNLRFASSLAEAADLAIQALATAEGRAKGDTEADTDADRSDSHPASPALLRGLFSGGTLAYEALLQLRALAGPLASNLQLPGVLALDDPQAAEAHQVIDLGEDEFTVGRPHPMIDPTLRNEQLRRAAEDPRVGTILLDVVLGDGAHPDPAGALAPLLRELRAGRPELPASPALRILTVVLGTGGDPQARDEQEAALREAGAEVFRDTVAAVNAFCLDVPNQAGSNLLGSNPPDSLLTGSVPLPDLGPRGQGDIAVINVGVETFYESLLAQGARAVHVDWRPPASGNAKLAGILARMKSKG